MNEGTMKAQLLDQLWLPNACFASFRFKGYKLGDNYLISPADPMPDLHTSNCPLFSSIAKPLLWAPWPLGVQGKPERSLLKFLGENICLKGRECLSCKRFSTSRDERSPGHQQNCPPKDTHRQPGRAAHGEGRDPSPFLERPHLALDHHGQARCREQKWGQDG